MEKYPSIFNDVLSPITPGPSSSNTCGPFRIASVCLGLLAEKPKALTINMAAEGGYPDTFYSMQSDLASLAGFLEKDLYSYPLTNAYDDAKAAGLSYSFHFVDYLPVKPTELAEIIVSGSTRTLKVIGVSLGGGEIELWEINGQSLLIDGKSYCMARFCKDGSISLTQQNEPFSSADIAAAEHLPDTDWVGLTKPVFPFAAQEKPDLPFSNAAELIAYAKESKLPFWKIALDYERAVTGASETVLLDYAEKVMQLCHTSIKGGADPNNMFTGVASPKASAYEKALHAGRLFSLGIADQGCLDSMRIMEYSNGHGTIVCMPTGGSSGIIPAAILCAAGEQQSSEEERIRALLVAGLFGVFYYPTHYTGAIGCQAEIGVAISMAAAALASMRTDDPDLIEAAASLGGQSLLGLVCNPVNGYVQVPCIIRNMAAVPIAVTCANGALAGMESLVPLDEVVDCMLKIGEKIRPCNQAGTYNIEMPK